MPGFSVAICTRNRSWHLRACLEGLVRQEQPPDGIEILVVDNGSTDATLEVAQAFFGRLPLRYLAEARTGLSHARNAALEATDSEWVVYLDDDAIPDPAWSREIQLGLDRWDPDIFGGPFVPHYPEVRPAWFDDRFGSAFVGDPEGLVPPMVCFIGNNMGWRRSLLQRVGGFDPDLGMVGDEVRLGEETAIQVSLWEKEPGLTRVMLPGMLISHFVSAEKMTLPYIARRSWIYGRQLGGIDPRNEVWRKAGLLRSLWKARFGLPLLTKTAWFAMTRRRPWQAYAADWLSLHAIHLGAAFEKKSLL